jgi:hypothetical protein
MHEDLDPKLMHMMFNVVGNFMSHIIPSLTTPIIPISHIAITHHHLPTRPCYTSSWQQTKEQHFTHLACLECNQPKFIHYNLTLV